MGIIDQQTQAQKTIIESAALAQKRQQEGYTYQQERAFDVAERVAQKSKSCFQWGADVVKETACVDSLETFTSCNTAYGTNKAPC